jgi:hypothetical protein
MCIGVSVLVRANPTNPPSEPAGDMFEVPFADFEFLTFVRSCEVPVYEAV